MVDRLEPLHQGLPKKTAMYFKDHLHLDDKDERQAFSRIRASEHPYALSRKVSTYLLAKLQYVC